MIKTCNICNEPKDISKFYKHPRGTHGVFPYCKRCAIQKHNSWAKNNRQAINSYRKSRYKKAPKNYLTQYWPGLTLAECLAEFDKLFVLQAGCCAICKKHQSELKVALAVDHDHRTGKVRGLLCSKCNPGLGYFADDIDLLERAANYLKRRKSTLKVVNDV